MKRGLLLSVLFVLVLTSSFASANLLTDFWGKITGNSVGACNDEYVCNSDDDCNDGYYCNLQTYCCDVSCQPSWSCGEWGACAANNERTKTCTDLNECQSDYVQKESCI